MRERKVRLFPHWFRQEPIVVECDLRCSLSSNFRIAGHPIRNRDLTLTHQSPVNKRLIEGSVSLLHCLRSLAWRQNANLWSNMSCLLPSLDPEILPQKKEITHRAILVRGLFSRQIGLPDSHAIDNPHVRSLMRQDALNEEVVDEDKSCLFATCGRAGADLRTAVDFYLKPKGPKNKPTYLTSLEPCQNETLAIECAQTNDPEVRWSSFKKVAGSDMVEDIALATRYFNKNSQAVLKPIAPLREQLPFDYFRERLSTIDSENLSPLNKRIWEDISAKMDGSKSESENGYQSRERLHEAIFSGESLPRVWRGRHPWCVGEKKEWRYLVDAWANEYHADRFGLSIVTTPTLRVPPHLCSSNLPSLPKFQTDEKDVSLPATVYADHLDLQFLIRLRNTVEFWETLRTLERPRNPTQALADHLTVISEEFKKYLIDVKKQPVLTTRAKIITRWTDAGIAVAGFGGAAIALVHQLPLLGTGIIALLGSAATKTVVQFTVDHFFSIQSVEDPGFAKFCKQLERASGRMIES